MTSVGHRAAPASRTPGTPPAAEIAHDAARGRIERLAVLAAGAVRVALVTRNERLATTIAALSKAANAELTRPNGLVSGSADAFGSEPFDVAILDYPCVSNISRRIRILRLQWPMCGIIVLNVPGLRECAALLDEGADDACSQSSPLVTERLHALVRRARTLNVGFRSAVGDVVVDREHRRVWCARREVLLSVKEYDLLLCLFDHSPQAVPTSALGTIVWRGTPLNRNTVEVYVGYIRRKLAASQTVGIHTIRGLGYTLREA